MTLQPRVSRSLKGSADPRKANGDVQAVSLPQEKFRIMLIDTHTHLDMLSAPLEEVFRRAEENDVTKMIYVGAGDKLEVYQNVIHVIERYPNVLGAVAFHPHEADKFQDLKSLEPYLSHPKVVAVGESGLDFYRNWSDSDNQIRLFKNTIGVAKELRKPLIIHSRSAREKTLEILKQEKASSVGGVFHCYAEDGEYAKMIADLGFKVSFTGVVTFKTAINIVDAVKDIPITQILIETDSPYMAPMPFRGKECEPMHVYYVAKKIAELKGLSLREASEIFASNTHSLFGI